MPIRTIELPKNGFALEIDGRLKTEFSTREGAEQGAIELKRRFPMLQIRIYDAASQSRQDLSLLASHETTQATPCQAPDLKGRQPSPASRARGAKLADPGMSAHRGSESHDAKTASPR
jgi:hypothetical protein